MTEQDEISILREELKAERERVAKLKAIVIKEKKNNSNLSAEVERISSCLQDVRQNNATLLLELEQLRQPAVNKFSDDNLQPSRTLSDLDQLELEEKLQNTERALTLSLAQLEDKNTILNTLSAELDETKSQLTVSKENERNCTSVIKQLESELFGLRKQRSLLDEKDQLLLESAAREKTLLEELITVKAKNATVNENHLKELNDLIAELKTREKETAARLKEQELQNKQLSEALFQFSDRDTTQESVVNRATVKLQQGELLVDSFSSQSTVLRKSSLMDSTNSLKLEAAAPDEMCREFLMHIRPYVNAVSAENSDFRLTESDFVFLLDYCAKLLFSSRSVTSKYNRIDTSEEKIVDSLNDTHAFYSTPSTQVDQETQYDLLAVTLANHHNVADEADTKSADLEVPLPRLHVTPNLPKEKNNEFLDNIDQRNNGDRLHTLKVKDTDLEKYAAEQENRTKLQIMDWSQKLELQAADYDHLIRGKEAEISELRETCDRLSEEVCTYLNFCSSLMIYMGGNDSCSDEQGIDWSSIADALNANENSMSGYELGGLLDTLFREIRTRLETAALSEFQSSAEPVVSEQPDNCQYEFDEVKEQLAVTTKALEHANKRASDAETVAVQLQEEIRKRDEKIQRMKQLLIRLKLDANGQQKMMTAVEEVENAKQRLMDEVECRAQELKESNVAKERAELALLKTREELSQLQLVMDSVKEERDLTIRRFNKLQSEYNAYKIKAVHTLRNSHSHDPTSSASHLIVSKSTEPEKDAIPSDLVTYKAEVERLNHQLVTSQQRMEEASLRASLARTECDLVKEDLVDLRQKYSELLKEFREQRTLWETKLGLLTREREHATDDRIRELENKLIAARAQFEEQLQSEQAQHQRMVYEERALWIAKLDKATEENKLLHAELETSRRNVNAFQGPDVVSKTTTSVWNQSPDTCFFSPRHTRGRMQGDGADNVNDEFDALSVSQLSLEQSGNDEERQKLGTPRPLILPLDQLLNKPNVTSRITTSVSSAGGSFSPRHYSGDLDLNGTLGLSIPASASASSQIAGLRVALTNQQRRVEHLSELLNESEANVARLEEQAKVLKEEIRRLERTAQRESQFALPSSVQDSSTINPSLQVNDSQLRTEYLKNVILKLVCSPADCAERPQLISVLSSLLLLSPSEQKALHDGVSSSQSAPGGVSWASYLVGWSLSKG